MNSAASILSEVIRQSSSALAPVGKRVVSLKEKSLLAAARARAGLEDLGEDHFLPPLRRLLASFEADADLNLLGRIGAREDMTRLLANRLLLREERRLTPGIAAESIRRPLFLTGLPRTGTTFLHGLLTADPNNRGPLTWETLFPARHLPPGWSRDDRAERAERQIAWFHRLAPDFQRIHPVGARLPEECLILTSPSFLSFQFQTSHRVSSYQAWLETQDLRPAYLQHREILQHLQHGVPPRRWVLKAPAHLFGLEALFAVYPDAEVILTHRDPVEVIASTASLHFELRRTFSSRIDRFEVGDEICRRWADGVGRTMAARDEGRVPADRFIDVGYSEILRDPIGVVRRIYEHFGRELGTESEAALRAHLAGHPKDRFGRHEYGLEEFGLDAERVRSDFRAYRERHAF